MNDPADSSYGTSLIQKYLKDYVEDLLPENYYPYVLSFSSNCDDSFMWRVYRASIALEFKSACLGNIPQWKLMECNYYTKEEVVEYISKNRRRWEEQPPVDVALDLARIKKPDFRLESEYRLMSCDEALAWVSYEDGIYDGEVPKGVKGRVTDSDNLILYKEIQLPKCALNRIIVYTETEQQFNHLREQILLLLKSHNIFLQPEQIVKSERDYARLKL